MRKFFCWCRTLLVNLNSYIQLQTPRKLSLFYLELLIQAIPFIIAIISAYLFGYPLICFCDTDSTQSSDEENAAIGTSAESPTGQSSNPKLEPGKAAVSEEEDAPRPDKGKRPLELECVDQNAIWDSMDQTETQKREESANSDSTEIKTGANWTAEWVTDHEERIGQELNKLRQEEHMRPLAFNRRNYVVDMLGDTYQVENFAIILKDLQDKGVNSEYYKASKIDNRNLPSEAEARADETGEAPKPQKKRKTKKKE